MCVLNSTGLTLDTGILEAASGLEAIGKKKKDMSFSSKSLQGLNAESILTVLFGKQLHHYKEETADLLQVIHNLIQSVSSFTKTCKTQ